MSKEERSATERTLKFGESTEIALRQYQDLIAEVYEHGAMTRDEREELRSYAAEIVHRMLTDNPEIFPYAAKMCAIWEKQHPGHPGNPWNKA